MSRTTFDLDPGLIEELKHLAARRRESMSQAAGRLLREALRFEKKSRTPRGPLRWHVVDGACPADGFDPATRDYLDLLDERT